MAWAPDIRTVDFSSVIPTLLSEHPCHRGLPCSWRTVKRQYFLVVMGELLISCSIIDISLSISFLKSHIFLELKSWLHTHRLRHLKRDLGFLWENNFVPRSEPGQDISVHYLVSKQIKELFRRIFVNPHLSVFAR